MITIRNLARKAKGLITFLYTSSPNYYLKGFRKNLLSPLENTAAPLSTTTFYERHSLLVVLHLHYLDSEQIFIDFASNLKSVFPNSKVIFTVNSEATLSRVESKTNHVGNITVRLVENRGRNFGPLFVELRDEVLAHDYLLHLHSKKSSHSSRDFGKSWANRNFRFFGNFELISQVLKYLNDKPEIGLVYVDSSDLLRALNYKWGENLRVLRLKPDLKFFKEFVTDKSGFINFPAGGMFLVRVSSIRDLFVFPWSYSHFPAEKGQISGTTQHFLERLIGEAVSARGQVHLVYFEGSEGFAEIHPQKKVGV